MLEQLREKAAKLPPLPGVYLMKDQSGTIIYVGKAKELVNRVSSYFRSVDKHTKKVYTMVENARDFDFIVTNSEFEALVLELSMIKLHDPKYNILLKDGKSYNYIRVTKEPFPRISAELSMDYDGDADFLGPYMSSSVTMKTVEEVHKIFKLPTCNRVFPRDFRKERPCLYYHIDRCSGVCRGTISQEEYNKTIQEALHFISTGAAEAVDRIETEMLEASERLEFERAAQLRDRLHAIRQISDQQNVVFVRAGSQDAISLVRSGDKAVAAVMVVRNERLVDKLDFQLGEIDTLPAARREFLLSYYEGQPEIPRVVSLDGPVEDMELITQYLSEKAGRKVEVHVPQRGDRLRLVEMATQNAAQVLSLSVQRSTGRQIEALDELARLLGLSSPPRYIEAYDISNFGEDHNVGAMVVFQDGRPLRSAYRKFNIKEVVGIDDYASMREMVSRRLARYSSQEEADEGFGRLPDLILLDGGKGHVNAVAPILEDMGFRIPLYGMVKDRSHRTRAIATDGGEISIQSTRSAFTLLSRIQDEVHRFAISHMRTRYKKTAFTSSLEGIPGMGEVRIQSLLTHFKTNKAIREASVEELLEAPRMTRPAAENVYAYFHPEAPTPTETS